MDVALADMWVVYLVFARAVRMDFDMVAKMAVSLELKMVAAKEIEAADVMAVWKVELLGAKMAVWKVVGMVGRKDDLMGNKLVVLLVDLLEKILVDEMDEKSADK